MPAARLAVATHIFKMPLSYAFATRSRSSEVNPAWIKSESGNKTGHPKFMRRLSWTLTSVSIFSKEIKRTEQES